jgi:5-methylcytosine-specific restriction protein B
LTYEIVPGAFSTICERAQSDPQNKYILVIDEINRGNIAKIFGELITLLEDDKRSQEGKGLYKVELTFSRNKFSVPANLYVLGTMNTADRSIALLDIALRRRFAFVELIPRADLLGNAVVETLEITVPLRELLHSLNQSISRDLGRDYQIGHSYFMKVAQEREEDAVECLEFIWRNQVLPLLKEYYYSQYHKLIELLRLKEVGDGSDADYAGISLDTMNRDDLLAMLADIADAKPNTLA